MFICVEVTRSQEEGIKSPEPEGTGGSELCNKVLETEL